MTAKEKVLKVYPQARRSRQHTHGGRGYTLIYSTYHASMYIGSGDTTAAAWRDAWKHIQAKQANEAKNAGVCTSR